MKSAVRAIAAIGALFLGVSGMWAFASPTSFFEQLANWPPYNEHFLHDIGAFQLGLAAVLVAGLVTRDAMTVALSGVATGSIFHALSHIIDSGEGGKSSDPIVFVVVALAFVVGLVLHRRSVGPQERLNGFVRDSSSR